MLVRGRARCQLAVVGTDQVGAENGLRTRRSLCRRRGTANRRAAAPSIRRPSRPMHAERPPQRQPTGRSGVRSLALNADQSDFLEFAPWKHAALSAQLTGSNQLSECRSTSFRIADQPQTAPMLDPFHLELIGPRLSRGVRAASVILEIPEVLLRLPSLL